MLIAKKSGFASYNYREREEFYHMQGLKGMTLAGVVGKGKSFTEVYESQTTDLRYKIVFHDEDEKLFKAMEENGYTLVDRFRNQAVFSYTGEEKPVPQPAKMRGRRIWYEIMGPLYWIVFLLNPLIQYGMRLEFIERFLYGMMPYAFLCGILCAFCVLTSVFNAVKLLFRFKLARWLSILYRVVCGLVVFAMLIQSVFMIFPFFNEKYQSIDYAPPILFCIEDIEPDAIIDADGEFRHRVFMLGECYELDESGTYNGTNFSLYTRVYVIESDSLAKFVYQQEQGKTVFDWMYSYQPLEDYTDTALNKGFDRIEAADFGEYLILKDNVIVRYSFRTYNSENPEVADGYKSLALEKLAENLDQIIAGA